MRSSQSGGGISGGGSIRARYAGSSSQLLEGWITAQAVECAVHFHNQKTVFSLIIGRLEILQTFLRSAQAGKGGGEGIRGQGSLGIKSLLNRQHAFKHAPIAIGGKAPFPRIDNGQFPLVVQLE